MDVFSTGWRQEGHLSTGILSTKSVHHGMYFPSTPLPSPPSRFLFLLSEKDMVGGCVKQDVSCMEIGERERGGGTS